MSQKTLQESIIKRFLSASEYEEFAKKYNASRRHDGLGVNRFSILEKEITEEDKELIRSYFNKENKTNDIAVKAGIKGQQLVGKVNIIAKRILYQHREALGL